MSAGINLVSVKLPSRPRAEHASLVAAGDPTQLKRAFGCFPSGVTAVCADLQAGPTGMLVSSFTSVSLNPPLVSICVMNSSQTWALLREAPRLGISVLAQDHHRICQRFASDTWNRFAGLNIARTAEGAVLLPEATAWLDCTIHDEVVAGDHTIVLLRIEALHARPALPPLVFHGSRFHRLVA